MKYDSFAVRGMANSDSSERATTLDWLFSIVCPKENNSPAHKVHGLDIDSLSTMLHYPWYSIHSGSYAVTSRMGSSMSLGLKEGRVYDDNS
jgi:hypothetical protein